MRSRGFFARREFSRCTTYDLDFCYLPGVNAGRWSPRAAPLYLVTITLGCMKCATGIQPSPHNSPIYDWAKLLSMRRIKSRARVQEKSAGRRDGRPRRRCSRSRVAFPRRKTLVGETRTDGRARRRVHARVSACDASPFSANIFLRGSLHAADKFAEKLNAVRRGCAHPLRAAMAASLGQSSSIVLSSFGKHRDVQWRDTTVSVTRK